MEVPVPIQTPSTPSCQPHTPQTQTTRPSCYTTPEPSSSLARRDSDTPITPGESFIRGCLIRRTAPATLLRSPERAITPTPREAVLLQTKSPQSRTLLRNSLRRGGTSRVAAETGVVGRTVCSPKLRRAQRVTVDVVSVGEECVRGRTTEVMPSRVDRVHQKLYSPPPQRSTRVRVPTSQSTPPEKYVTPLETPPRDTPSETPCISSESSSRESTPPDRPEPPAEEALLEHPVLVLTGRETEHPTISSVREEVYPTLSTCSLASGGSTISISSTISGLAQDQERGAGDQNNSDLQREGSVTTRSGGITQPRFRKGSNSSTSSLPHNERSDQILRRSKTPSSSSTDSRITCQGSDVTRKAFSYANRAAETTPTKATETAPKTDTTPKRTNIKPPLSRLSWTPPSQKSATKDDDIPTPKTTYSRSSPRARTYAVSNRLKSESPTTTQLPPRKPARSHTTDTPPRNKNQEQNSPIRRQSYIPISRQVSAPTTNTTERKESVKRQQSAGSPATTVTMATNSVTTGDASRQDRIAKFTRPEDPDVDKILAKYRKPSSSGSKENRGWSSERGPAAPRDISTPGGAAGSKSKDQGGQPSSKRRTRVMAQISSSLDRTIDRLVHKYKRPTTSSSETSSAATPGPAAVKQGPATTKQRAATTGPAATKERAATTGPVKQRTCSGLPIDPSMLRYDRNSSLRGSTTTRGSDTTTHSSLRDHKPRDPAPVTRDHDTANTVEKNKRKSDEIAYVEAYKEGGKELKQWGRTEYNSYLKSLYYEYKYVISICLFDCLSVCLIVCLSVCLFVCLAVCFFVSLFVWLFVWNWLVVCWFICLFVWLFSCLFVCLSACLSDCLAHFLSVCSYTKTPLFFSSPHSDRIGQTIRVLQQKQTDV
eukprot:sb/3461926/